MVVTYRPGRMYHRDKLSTCQKPPSMPPELSHRAGGVHWAVKHARLLVVRRLGPPEHPWGPTKWALNVIKIEFEILAGKCRIIKNPVG